MNKCEISVVISVYNTKRFLSRCIDSLLRQRVPIKLILVDDGSTDGSEQICDQYAAEYSNITVIHKSNGGSGSAKNAGIDCVETEFIGFVDSDDWITDDMYDFLLKTQKSFQADVVQIEYLTVAEGNEVGKTNCKEDIDFLESHDIIMKRYLEDGMKPVKSYSACTKLYRKSLFDGIRFPENQAYDDVTTNFLLLSKANKYIISNKQCYFYFVRNKSITKGKYCLKDLDYIKAGEQIAQWTADDPNLTKLGKMTLARFHFTCLCKIFKYGCEEDVDWEKQVRSSIPIIRSKKIELMKSGMQKNRIVLMYLLCLNIELTVKLFFLQIKRKS